MTLKHLLGGTPDWQQDALCAQTDPAAFYPSKGESLRPAKAVCRGCDVRAECLTYALDRGERHGIWGGLSGPERRRILTHRAPREAAA